MRSLAVAAIVIVVAVSCRVSTDDVATSHQGSVDAASQPDTSPTAGVASPTGGGTGLPIIGPVPASSHWHAAYVVRICEDVLPPFESEADPLGIHSHGDGVMHVHPFFEESGYEAATLRLFADAMGFSLSDGELTLPGGGTWRDGDLCDGVPGRVFVDRWRDPNPESEVERLFTGLDQLRYLADGELYQIAFAPADSFPVVPPSRALLSELSNLASSPDPWIDVGEPSTLDEVEFWAVGGIGAEPCVGDSIPERVLFGPVRCFDPAGQKISGLDAVLGARAVEFNRQPAVEVRMGQPLIELIGDHFSQSENPLAFAIEVDGFVVTAPQIQRPPVSDRLVVSGGFSIETARQLESTLNGDT